MCSYNEAVYAFVLTLTYILLIFLLQCVAAQYHWILNESVLYLGKSIGQAKCKQDESNVSTCPVILYSYPFNEKFVVHARL